MSDDDRNRAPLTINEAFDLSRLSCIGQIVMTWDLCERTFCVLTWRLADLPAEIGKIITHDLPNVPLITLSKNLVNYQLKGDDNKCLRHDALQVIELFDECRKARNDVIHASSALIDDQLIFYKSTFKTGKGEESTRIAIHFTEDLEKLAEIMLFCNKAIMGVVDSLKSRETPCYDRDTLQIYLTMLRSPPQSI